MQPVLDVVESFAISHIVDDQASESFAIMSHRDSSVLLLASGIPKLGLNRGAILHGHVLGSELDTDCRSIVLGQLILQIATQ